MSYQSEETNKGPDTLLLGVGVISTAASLALLWNLTQIALTDIRHKHDVFSTTQTISQQASGVSHRPALR